VPNPPSKDPTRIARMFDAISPRYDLLNHLLSAGFDVRWRRQAIRALALNGREVVLDLCTGTADLAVAAATASRGGAARVVGVDFAAAMLELGLAKIRARGLGHRVTLVRGDATDIPLADSSVDAAMIAFGIRNVDDPGRAGAELARVIRPGGRLAILEFGIPWLPVIRSLYLWYFRRVLPAVGRLISRHDDAYSYLPESVSTFPEPAAFSALLGRAGFTRIEARPLSLGVVYLYLAERTSSSPRPGE
jgi:demethylmenaquinone methyltransferase/2-methoxy-6-polyprenyl-1,4-benzoquinol methylase